MQGHPPIFLSAFVAPVVSTVEIFDHETTGRSFRPPLER
jgi:hypothetical protein